MGRNRTDMTSNITGNNQSYGELKQFAEDRAQLEAWSDIKPAVNGFLMCMLFI